MRGRACSLKAGALSDQQSIQSSQTQLTSALNDQKKGDLADAQAVDTARNDVNTAEAQVAQQLAAKGVQEAANFLGITWTFEPKQSTTLHLSSRHAEPAPRRQT